MSDAMLGADPASLQALARQMSASSALVDRVSTTLDATIRKPLRWHGPDAEAFTSRWSQTISPTLRDAVDLLQETSDVLERNAEEQIRASAIDGSSAQESGAATTPPQATPFEAVAHPAFPDRSASDAAGNRAWWRALSPEEQNQFIQDHPGQVGSLDGIPVASRVEANRLVAAEQLRRSTFAPGEKAYLEKVVSGSVQLVAYDPGKGNLIELLGRYDQSTTTVVTYVPGTFAKIGDFYTGDLQQMGNFLEHSDPSHSTAVFVYKNSAFPQDPTFLQSNDKTYAMHAGTTLHRFESALGLENPPQAQTVAVSHSWGESAVASSEVQGTHYDQQIALSGAAMPESWRPDPTTRYAYLAFSGDPLAIAEKTGITGDNYPKDNPAFRQYIYNNPEPSFELGGVQIPRDLHALGINHGLIAKADDPRNADGRRDLARLVYGS
ncbi:WXG100 family type VII secretion target [Psychromicrobium xiongbiense]|uniref:WXG100 family type VII secretion target n=1 Tax=Psychromicrobium xiongbiense TaxID=3051184 RepID=UPI0025570DDF|nr:hypothetical protein [Psychromicrobium sp. YIM S02556]